MVQTNKRSGFLYKLGEGPINFNWNSRYCILEKNRLLYFNKPTDRNLKGALELDDAQVSSIHEINGHPFSFTVSLTTGKSVHFSHDISAEADSWRVAIGRAAFNRRLSTEVNDEKADDQARKHRRSVNSAQISQQMQSQIDQLQEIYTGVRSDWRLIAVKQGLRLVTSDNLPLTLLHSNLGFLGLVFLLSYFGLWLIGLSPWLTLPVCLWQAYKLKFIDNTRFKWVKASTIIDSSSSEVFEALMDLSHRGAWDCMLQVKESKEQPNIGVESVSAALNAPLCAWWSCLVKPLDLQLERYWVLNSDYTYYYILKSAPAQPDYYEGFVVSELDADKTAVTMVFNIETSLFFWVEEQLKFQRILALGALRNFVIERSFDHKADFDKQASQIDKQDNGDSPKIETESSKYVLFNDGKPVPLESRIPGYTQAKGGGIKCVNRADLDCQKGLILDLIKRAGKTLMEGKNVVGVSLPVRIFEPRSTLERMVDWWCTLPVYLTNAARASDPLERLKQVVAFAISGLYYGTRQLKPFNPILGETFQGVFLDGTEIFIEHTSHHPPVSNFLVLGPSSLFRYRGFYEYKGKLGLTGNYVTGKQAGPNIVEFNDGSHIVYERPLVKITGLMVGDRLLEYQEDMTFRDPYSELECYIRFAEKPGLFSKSKTPCDSFAGEIRHRGTAVCTVSGSYLDQLKFDDTVYWELATSPIYLPVRPTEALPSDCRFRADLQALLRGDRNTAEQAKARLENLQRNDRKLREQRGPKH